MRLLHLLGSSYHRFSPAYSQRNVPGIMAFTHRTNSFLKLSIALLMLSAAVEMALLSATVYWLHYRAGKSFNILWDGGSFDLHGKPANLLLNQGHTSNGAAGTAFVAIGLGSLIVFWLRNRSLYLHGRVRGFAKFMYNFWLIMTFLSALLSIAALVYVFYLTSHYSGQYIDLTVASKLNNQPYPNYEAYPLDAWTPESWLWSLLQLPTTALWIQSERNDIRTHWMICQGWRYNLIPLASLGLLVLAAAVVDWRKARREERGKGRTIGA